MSSDKTQLLRQTAPHPGFYQGLVVLFLLLSCIGIPPCFAQPLSKLQRIHQQIEQKYVDVEHIEAKQIATRRADVANIVLLDVREQHEYDVSRLDGAIRVPPDITRQDFIKLFGSEAGGKSFVFYCATGARSSALISRIQDDLLASGAVEIYNLEGGIFNWHNQNRYLVNQSGDTEYVHPYNFFWQRTLNRPTFTRYKP